LDLLVLAGDNVQPAWYEKFNTKVDVGSAIGVSQQHKVLLEYVAQENHMLAFTAFVSPAKTSGLRGR
jgi:hypothetical protein